MSHVVVTVPRLRSGGSSQLSQGQQLDFPGRSLSMLIKILRFGRITKIQHNPGIIDP